MSVRRNRIVGRRPILTPQQQQQLRDWAAIGTNQVAAARYFKVSSSTIAHYLKGRHKAHVRDYFISR